MEVPMWPYSSAGETILQVGSNSLLVYAAGWTANGYCQPLVSVNLMMPCGLNPFAEPWHPAINRAPEADRSLFLTFSNGCSVTQNEIYRFFADQYGNCVERVYVHWPAQKNNGNSHNDDLSTAQFGKILFRGATIPQVLTACGTKERKFSVEGKPLWCKRFDPSKMRFYWKN